MFIEVHTHTYMHTPKQAAAWGPVSEAKDAHLHKHTHSQVDITTSTWIGNRHSQTLRRLAAGTLLEALLAHKGLSLPVLPPDCGDAFLVESNPSSCDKGEEQGKASTLHICCYNLISTLEITCSIRSAS